MTVPYHRPRQATAGQPASVSLASCLAASELIDQYLGGGSLAYRRDNLTLRFFHNNIDRRWIAALPTRPIISAELNDRTGGEFDFTTETRSAAPDAPHPPINRMTARQVDYLGRVRIDVIWGWPKPDSANSRTRDVGDVIAGDVESSTALADGIDSTPGECWWLFKPADTIDGWHCEMAYVKDDGSLERYAEGFGSASLAGGKAQRIEWPEGLDDATATAARRLEQLKKSPGFQGYDSPAAQAVLHQITRSLDRYRP